MHDHIHVIIECDILECKRTAHVNKRVAKANHKYGIKVPRTVAEALKLDRENQLLVALLHTY